MVDHARIGHVGRVVQLLHRRVRAVDAIDHRRRGRDQVEVELAGQALLDDLQMQEAEKAAAEAEAERGRGLRLVVEARVVEAELAETVTQLLEIVGVHRIEPAPDHRHGRLEAGQRLGGRAPIFGDGIADAAIGDGLDRGGEKTDLAGAEILHRQHLRRKDADLLDRVHRTGGHHAHALAAPQAAVLHPDQRHYAEIRVVPAIDQQRLERCLGIALRRRQAGDEGFQHLVDIEPGLGADHHRVGCVQPDHLLDLLAHPLGLGGGEVDFVEHRHDLVAGLDRLVDIGERLRLDALAGVDHQQRALAGSQAAADLVGEIHMARRVHQVQRVGLAVLGGVGQANGLRLDGDAALALEVHGIEHLLGHFARGQRPRRLDQAVREGGLAVIDMGDDGEVADLVDRGIGHAGCSAQPRRQAGAGED